MIRTLLLILVVVIASIGHGLEEEESLLAKKILTEVETHVHAFEVIFSINRNDHESLPDSVRYGSAMQVLKPFLTQDSKHWSGIGSYQKTVRHKYPYGDEVLRHHFKVESIGRNVMLIYKNEEENYSFHGIEFCYCFGK